MTRYSHLRICHELSDDANVKMQVAFMLGRHQVFLELPEEMDDYEDFTEILSNSHLNTHFLSLGQLGTSLPRSTPPLFCTCGPPNEVRKSEVRKNFQKCRSNRYGKVKF
ncbi:26S proteasome non-ATPase regulatory subunit 2 [Portunus trituberculatus]|uniref:26S proteasome non-ATPase regulatory subunit 2 n=1 Tax=Portunus trituberculatus TaxID=210409 RepID=A0A5B7H7Y3_PORTR|nr:26S proteasome non-ATPase regulatory subunit 2 [Portunus trituberculatus]